MAAGSTDPTTNPTTATNDLGSVVDAWNEFFAAVRRARGRAARQTGNELTLSQFALLKPLAESDDGLRIGELADQAGIAAPTASRTIETLEREGIVARQRSTTDRRATAITLTPKGSEMYRAKEEVIEAKRDEMFRSLSPAERVHAERLLRRMADLMEEL